MLPAADAERGVVEARIARIGLGDVLGHPRHRATLLVDIAPAHWTDKPLSPLFRRKNDVITLLAVLLQLRVIRGDGTSAG